ncbi:MAG: CRTAC1 family protein [Bradymonadia bacterium]
MNRSTAVMSVVMLSFIGALAMTACQKAPQTSPAADASVDILSTKDNSETKETKETERTRRAQLDKTVWADEVLAQAHEAVFVDLWDRLRGEPKAAQILGNFPFERLRVCEPNAAPGDKKAPFACGWLSPQSWTSRLMALQTQGYRLTQSEWHHRRFIPGNENAGAQSVLKITLHVENRSESSRYIIEGSIRVAWMAAQQTDSTPRVASIDATGLKVSHSGVSPPFKPEVIFSSRDTPVLPLVVQDFDFNGFPDIALPGSNVLLRNTNGAFKSEQLFNHPLPPSNGPLQVHSAVATDFDNDGFHDMLVVRRDAPPLLYKGGSDKLFPRPAESIALGGRPLKEPSATAVGDIDGDGDLDVLLTQYKEPFVSGQFPSPYYDANDGYPRRLLKNMGGGRFIDATIKSGLDKLGKRRTYAASFLDLDDDHDLDLLVTSDFSGVDVFINDGSGRFEEQNKQWLKTRHTFGMSHAFGDLDRDGRLDIFVTGMASTTARRLTDLGLGRKEFTKHQTMRPQMGYGNRLYHAGRGQLSVTRYNDDVARSGWSWGTTLFDYDNNGLDDIFVANGHISGKTATDYCTEFWRHDIYEDASSEGSELDDYYSSRFAEHREGGVSWNGFEHNHLFVNQGHGRFKNKGFLMGVAAEDDSRSAVSVDADADGRMDLLVSVSPTQNDRRFRLILYRNQGQHPGEWVGLKPTRGSRSLIGAKATAQLENGTLRRVFVTGDSFMSQHPQTLHIGLGQKNRVRSLELRWPDGSTQQLAGLKNGQYHKLPVVVPKR